MYHDCIDITFGLPLNTENRLNVQEILHYNNSGMYSIYVTK